MTVCHVISFISSIIHDTTKSVKNDLLKGSRSFKQNVSMFEIIYNSRLCLTVPVLFTCSYRYLSSGCCAVKAFPSPFDHQRAKRRRGPQRFFNLSWPAIPRHVTEDLYSTSPSPYPLLCSAAGQIPTWIWFAGKNQKPPPTPNTLHAVLFLFFLASPYFYPMGPSEGMTGFWLFAELLSC